MGTPPGGVRLAEQAVEVAENKGDLYPELAASLTNPAALYRSMGEHARALPLSERALAIDEQALGAEHPDTRIAHENLAFAKLKSGGRAAGCRDLAHVLARRRTTVPRVAAVRSEQALDIPTSGSLALLGVALERRSGPSFGPALLEHLLHVKARATEELRSVLESIRGRGGPDVLELLRDFLGADSRLASLECANSPPKTLREASHRRADADRALPQGSAQLRAAVATPTAAGLRLKLPAGAALVEIVRYPPFLGRPGKTLGDP